MTFPYLNTLVPLLDIMLYWIYLSVLEHIRASTGYHALLDIPFHTWTHSYFYWISCSTSLTYPGAIGKGVSRNLGSKGGLGRACISFLESLGVCQVFVIIIIKNYQFIIWIQMSFIHCTQVLMRTSKVTYPIPCSPTNLTQLNPSAARHPNHLPLVFFWCFLCLIAKIVANATTKTNATTITIQNRGCCDTPWLGSWCESLTSFSFVGKGMIFPLGFFFGCSLPVKKITEKDRQKCLIHQRYFTYPV